MDWSRGRESQNVEDRRGAGGGGFGGGAVRVGGLGGVGVIVLTLVGLYFGIDPRILIGALNGGGGGGYSTDQGSYSQPAQPPQDTAQDQQRVEFVKLVLGDTETTWHQIFQAGGADYREPKLVLYTGGVDSACGEAQSATGPFYCPGDEKVYLDLSFFDELAQRFGAPGDFAQAYVIAHEVGHHVQKLLGITDKVEAAQQQNGGRSKQVSVMLELQADCFAGVWANHADAARHVLQPGDLEEGLKAAAAVGDDRIQKATRGYVVPDSFTHGSSEQRVRWFRRGLESGQVNACNTFNAGNSL